jgi:uncharacterized protein YbaR (Trm112 family)
MTAFELIAIALLGMLAAAMTVLVGGTLISAAKMQRIIDRLAKTPCPVCRQPLGRKAVDTGRRISAEMQHEYLDEPRPSAQVDALPYWPLVCPHCQSELVYAWERGEWVSVKHPYEAE